MPAPAATEASHVDLEATLDVRPHRHTAPLFEQQASSAGLSKSTMAPKKAGVTKVAKEAKPRKEKKAKDPNAVRTAPRKTTIAVLSLPRATDPSAPACPQPKRPTSAYFYYAADARPEIKKTDPGLCARTPSLLSSFPEADASPSFGAQRSCCSRQGRNGRG